MKKMTLILLAAFSIFCGKLFADDPDLSLSEHLKIFQPLIGKTFRGEFANSTPDKPMFDVSKWERALNGQAIRVLHSVNDGIYGGETIIMWDAENEKIAYWYFTTAGFRTTGTMEIEGWVWTSLEKVVGNKQGITEVRATSELKPDGTLSLKSEFYQNEQWVPGHELTYHEAPDYAVKFK